MVELHDKPKAMGSLWVWQQRQSLHCFTKKECQGRKDENPGCIHPYLAYCTHTIKAGVLLLMGKPVTAERCNFGKPSKKPSYYSMKTSFWAGLSS